MAMLSVAPSSEFVSRIRFAELLLAKVLSNAEAVRLPLMVMTPSLVTAPLTVSPKDPVLKAALD